MAVDQRLHQGPSAPIAPEPVAGGAPSRAAHPHAPARQGRVVPVGALVRLTRPRQWAKNGLVFAAPAAAGVLFHGDTIGKCLLSFLAFCLVASGVYCGNDAVDAKADRVHPTKRRRPVASGAVPVPVAISLSIVLMLAGIALAAVTVNAQVGLILALYVAFQAGYSFGLKREPVVELVLVASGFVLRTVAGGLAADVALSSWFVAVAGGAAMLVVAGKRLAEMHQLGSDAAKHRAVLGEYTPVFLQLVVAIFGGLVIIVYCLWAFGEQSTSVDSSHALWIQVSAVPFLIAILRYIQMAEKGEGGEPEEVLLRHRPLQILGLVWLALFLVGVSGA